MYQIEPIEQVVTKRSVVLTLDEDEIAKVLVDARGLQKQLRQVKAQWYGKNGNVWSETGHASTRKARAGKKAAEKKSGARGQKCPKCHRVFKKLGRHTSTCTGNKDPFGVPAASALDD